MITHNLYCKEDIELAIYSTFSISPHTMSPSEKKVKFWKDIEYAFIQKEDTFSDRYVHVYYIYMGQEYMMERQNLGLYFHGRVESRKIKIDKVLKD